MDISQSGPDADSEQDDASSGERGHAAAPRAALMPPNDELAEFEAAVARKINADLIREVAEDYDGEGHWTADRLNAIFEGLRARWLPRDITSEEQQGGWESFWNNAFGQVLPSENDNTPIRQVVQMQKEHVLRIGCLQAMMGIRGMFGHDKKYQEDINKILLFIKNTATRLRALSANVATMKQNSSGVQEGEISMDNFVFEDATVLEREKLRAVTSSF